MRALTLWQPMAWAISDYTKRIENRSWSPPNSLIRKRIAIHAGKRYSREHAEQIEAAFGVKVPPKSDLPLGAIVATAVVRGYASRGGGFPFDFLEETVDPWYSGPYGWLLEDVVKLREPIIINGAQGLWRLPSDIGGLLSGPHHEYGDRQEANS